MGNGPSSEVALRTQLVATSTELQKTKERLESVETNTVSLASFNWLQESLAELQLQIEDRNYTKLGTRSNLNGLSVQTVQKLSDDLRPRIVATGELKRIIELRGNYIYGDGVGFANLGGAKAAFDDEMNQERLWSMTALLEVNRAHGTDGNFVVLVNKTTQQIRRIPFDELGEPFVDGDDRERVWYWRRTYTRFTASNAEGERVDEYYPTPDLPEKGSKRTRVQVSPGNYIPVNLAWTAIAWKVNGQTGWPLGMPDLFASLPWVEKHTNYLKNQDRFAEALALIAWQIKESSTAAQLKQQTAMTHASIADIASTGKQTEMVPMAGNSAVSFENGNPMAGQAAAAGEVMMHDVLADGQGSDDLDRTVKGMIQARRASATAFFTKIARALGAGDDFKVIWPDLEKESPFREAQMIIAAWGTGNFSPEEVRPALASKLNIEIAEGSKSPDDVLIPNTLGKLEAETKVKAAAAPSPADPDSDEFQNGQGKDALGVGKTTDGDNEARDKGEYDS
jgi:hypothetical protein